MPPFANIDPVFLALIIARLVPWFLTVVGDDAEAAQQAARRLLASYHPETEDELALAAETVVFSLNAIDAEGQSAAPDLPVATVLRLRASAVAHSRAAHNSRRALERSRTERAPLDAEPAEAAATPEPPRSQPILTRQQRRALERAIEKSRRQKAEAARRDAMRAMRMGTALPEFTPGPLPRTL